MSSFSSSRILVTGANGFIGRHLVRALAARQGGTVVALGRSAEPALPAGCEYARLDLTDRQAVVDFAATGRFDYVFHLAGEIDQSVTPGIYARQINLHLNGTLHLIEALAKTGLQRFIHVGSNAEYGAAAVPQSPGRGFMPNSAYGVTKLAASKLALAKAVSEGFPAIVARPFLVYGEGEGKRSFLAQAIAAAGRKENFPTSGGEQTRDFVPVEWVVADLLKAAELPVGAEVNLCTGVETMLRQVLSWLHEMEPQFRPQFGALPYRPTELMRSVGVPLVSRTAAEGEQMLKRHLSTGLAALK